MWQKQDVESCVLSETGKEGGCDVGLCRVTEMLNERERTFKSSAQPAQAPRLSTRNVGVVTGHAVVKNLTRATYHEEPKPLYGYHPTLYQMRVSLHSLSQGQVAIHESRSVWRVLDDSGIVPKDPNLALHGVFHEGLDASRVVYGLVTVANC